ncbi:MAG: DUF726 domain-containing protein [Haloarculaceae archaeon]
MAGEGATQGDEGESTRNGGIDRRRVLRGVGVAGAAGAGLAAVTGTAAAAEEQCLFMRDAPADQPMIERSGDHYETVSGYVPYEPSEVVFYVHGWLERLAGGAKDQGYTVECALERAGYDYPVVTVKWPSNSINPQSSIEPANASGRALAQWLKAYQSDNPETTIRLVAHSLGARTSLACIDELVAIGGDPVDSLAILGGAVVRDVVTVGGEFGDAVADGAGTVHNYYSQEDAVIDHLFKLGNGEPGLGAEGAAAGEPVPDNYADFDVTDSVGGHCIYFKPKRGCMDQVVANLGKDLPGDGPVTDSGWWPF